MESTQAMAMKRTGGVLILDFGSQYTQLIARRIRQLHIYCEIHPHTLTLDALEAHPPGALILSGGPASIYDAHAPAIQPGILEYPVPILGICYGQQLLVSCWGGQVQPAQRREYGRACMRIHGALRRPTACLGWGFDPKVPFEVWMSHGDEVVSLPKDFVSLAFTDSTPYAAVAHTHRPLVGFQFHPEVSHTPRGVEWLEWFLFKVAGLKPTWTMASFLEQQLEKLSRQVGASEQVICALSGGVDSAVVAALLGRAVGPRLHCILVDNGLMRQGEATQIQAVFQEALQLPLKVVAAQDRFLKALDQVADPELKRKTIGRLFVEIFEEEAKKVKGARYLAQGTLYPDVIESTQAGPSLSGAPIKSHHNVGGLPERMNLTLLEPLRTLFKDEVRLLGSELGLPPRLCQRQPFPGPGLAVRMVGPISLHGLEIVRHADTIVEEEMVASGCDAHCWQSFAVLLPVRSVGVMGDGRTYEQTLVLRCVESLDGMTADWVRLPHDVLARIANRLINEVRGINRVVYDISSKPPATIEWE